MWKNNLQSRVLVGCFAALICLITPLLALGTPSPDHIPKTCEQPTQQSAGPEIFLLTMAPGDMIWNHFGHNGLWIREPGKDPYGVIYNFGVFEFNMDLIDELLEGHQRFWLGTRSYQSMMKLYAREGRHVVAQRLDLPQDVAKRILKKLRWQSRKENREYLYHWSQKNCSTQIRDLINQELNGALIHQHTDNSGFTERGEILRHLSTDEALRFGLDYAMGHENDLTRTWWEITFMPVRLYERMKVSTIDWKDGVSRPLVAYECELYEGIHPAAPPTPPQRSLLFWLIGASIGGLFAGMAKWSARREHRPVRWAFAITATIFTFSLAALGAVSAWLWWSGDIAVFQMNVNLFLIHPLTLLWGLSARATQLAPRFARTLGLILSGIAFLALPIGLLPWTQQDNLSLVGLFLLPQLGILWGVWMLSAKKIAAQRAIVDR